MWDGILYESPMRTKCNFNFYPASQINLSLWVWCSPNALNELNLALSQGKYWHNMKKIKDPFFLHLDRIELTTKPSHATVPLSQYLIEMAAGPRAGKRTFTANAAPGRQPPPPKPRPRKLCWTGLWEKASPWRTLLAGLRLFRAFLAPFPNKIGTL